MKVDQGIQDALPQSLTQCPTEPHICPICNNLVPKGLYTILGIEKEVQPRCRCEVEKMEADIHRIEDLKIKHDVQSKFSISTLGVRFSNSTFNTFKGVNGTEKALYECKEYADSFPSESEAPLIWGECGNGKSHLAAAVAHSVQEKGYTVVFQTMPELLERIRQTFNDRNSKETEKDIMYALNHCKLLILDDIGAEKVTEWVQEVLFRIIDGRYRQKNRYYIQQI